jgi:hypothetical protein
MSDGYLDRSWDDLLHEPKTIDAEDILKYETARRDILKRRRHGRRSKQSMAVIVH